jgi:hypothetical protein
MKRALLLLLILFSTTASAQLDLTSQLRDIFGGICNFASGYNLPLNLSWACDAGAIISKADSIVRALHGDMRDFGRVIGEQALNTTLSQLSSTAAFGDFNEHLADIENALQQIDDGLDTGLSAYRNALYNAVEDVTAATWRNILTDQGATGPTATINEEGRNVLNESPAAQAVMAESIATESENAKRQADITYNGEGNRKLAEQFADNNSVEDTVARIVTPVTGSASTAKRDAATALSTRSSIQVLTNTVADMMSSEAVIGAATVEGLKTLTQQNIYSNAQMGLIAQSILAEKQAESAKARIAFETELGLAAKENQALGASITDTISALANTFDPEDTEPLPSIQEAGW